MKIPSSFGQGQNPSVSLLGHIKIKVCLVLRDFSV